MRTIERPRDRRELVSAAGLPATSLASVLAGTLVAFGAIGLLLAGLAGLGELFDVDTADLNGDNWQDIGIGGAIGFAVVTLLAYAFGGYTAGRMARRAGVRHGVLVFLLGLLLTLGVAGIASGLGDTDAAADELRDQGVPTDADDWTGVGIGAAAATLAAMVVGAVLGGMRGERWHGRLVTRAADPEVRSRDEARAADVEQRESEARGRVQDRYADQRDADEDRNPGRDERTPGWEPVGAASSREERVLDTRSDRSSPFEPVATADPDEQRQSGWRRRFSRG